MTTIVTRDGEPVSPRLSDENAAFAWLLKHQSMSTDWAIKYEGYAIVDLAAYLASTLENAAGAADVAVMLNDMPDGDIRLLMAHYEIRDEPEAPRYALNREIARQAGWSI